jgi:hypothetical protein
LVRRCSEPDIARQSAIRETKGKHDTSTHGAFGGVADADRVAHRFGQAQYFDCIVVCRKMGEWLKLLARFRSLWCARNSYS